MENTEKQEVKKKNNLLLFFLLAAVLIVGGFFLMGDGFFENEEEEKTETEETEIQEEEIQTETEVEVEERVEEEGTGIEVVEDFPEDIPILDGDIVRSEIQTFMAITILLTDNTVEEEFELYKEAFEETDWIIEEMNETDEYHDIIFGNGIEFGEEGHRRGRIAILHDENENRTSVTVRESF